MSEIKVIWPKLIPYIKTATMYFISLSMGEQPSYLAAALKCSPIISLIFFVLIHPVGSREKKYSNRILLGLLFSLVGDALLIWPDQFITGMAFFGMAQICYTMAYGCKPLHIWLAVLIYTVTTYVTLSMLPKADGLMRIGLPIYCFLLATQLWRAIARADCWPKASAAFGGMLFAISDGLIGVDLFIEKLPPFGQILIMSTYYIAQLLITLSIVDEKKAGVNTNNNVPTKNDSQTYNTSKTPKKSV